MADLTPADRLKRQSADLAWAQRTVAAQPVNILRQYEAAARAIVAALGTRTLRFALQVPDVLVTLTENNESNKPTEGNEGNAFIANNAAMSRLNLLVVIRAGTLLSNIRNELCHDQILAELNKAAHADHLSAAHVRVLNYLASLHMLDDELPSPELVGQLRAIDPIRRRLLTVPEQAETILEALFSYAETLKRIEQLYPGVLALDRYTVKRTAILTNVIEQGRGYVAWCVNGVIDELLETTRTPTAIYGLTVDLPYLDESRYRIARYALEIMPRARIPFAPMFVASACARAEQEVRRDPRYSTATAWGIVTGLEQLRARFTAEYQPTP